MYSTEVASIALGVERKVLDNFIDRSCRDLLPPGSRGRDRWIEDRTLQIIAVGMLLSRDLDMPAAAAVRIGIVLVDGDHSAPVGALGVLRFDIARLQSVLQTALADAAEVYVPRARGRPPKKKKRGAPY